MKDLADLMTYAAPALGAAPVWDASACATAETRKIETGPLITCTDNQFPSPDVIALAVP